MEKDKHNRNVQLLRELHLIAENRRPVKADWLEDGMEMADLIDQYDFSQNEAADFIAKKRSIHRSSAKRLNRKYIGIRDNPVNKDRGHWEWELN